MADVSKFKQNESFKLKWKVDQKQRSSSLMKVMNYQTPQPDKKSDSFLSPSLSPRFAAERAFQQNIANT